MPCKTEPDKRCLTQLEQQLQALQCKQQQLLQEKAALCGVIGFLEAAARQHSHVTGVLQRLHPLFDNTGPTALQSWRMFSVAELLRLLPLSVVSAITPTSDKYLHKSVMTLTHLTAARHWNQAVGDLQMLLYLHSRSPVATQHDLAMYVKELTRWSCAVYMFNPLVLQELAGTNLRTMERMAVPAEHWEAAWTAAELSDIQRRQLTAVKRFLTPKLAKVTTECQQLAAGLAELNAEAAGCQSCSYNSPSAGGDSMSTAFTSTSGSIEQRRWHAAQQLARANKAWRVLTQLQLQLIIAILEPWQAATVIVGVYPYMLLGEPLFQGMSCEDGSQPCASSTAAGDQVTTAAGLDDDAGPLLSGVNVLHMSQQPMGSQGTTSLGSVEAAADAWGNSGTVLGASVVGDNFSSMEIE